MLEGQPDLADVFAHRLTLPRPFREVEQATTLGRLDESGHDPRESCFAGTVSADDQQPLAPMHRQVHIVECIHLPRRSAQIRVSDAAQRQHRFARRLRTRAHLTARRLMPRRVEFELRGGPRLGLVQLRQPVRAVRHDTTGDEVHDPIRRDGLQRPVRDHHDGDAASARKVAEYLEEFGATGRVDHRRHLVGDEQRGIASEGSRDRQPLLLTAGEVGRLAVAKACQAHLGQQAVDVDLGSFREPPDDIVGDARAEHLCLGSLQHHGCAAVPAQSRGAGSVHRSARRTPARQDLRQCRLSRAVCSDDGDELARFDPEVDVGEDLGSARLVGESHVIELEGQRRHRPIVVTGVVERVFAGDVGEPIDHRTQNPPGHHHRDEGSRGAHHPDPHPPVLLDAVA